MTFQDFLINFPSPNTSSSSSSSEFLSCSMGSRRRRERKKYVEWQPHLMRHKGTLGEEKKSEIFYIDKLIFGKSKSIFLWGSE